MSCKRWRQVENSSLGADFLMRQPLKPWFWRWGCVFKPWVAAITINQCETKHGPTFAQVKRERGKKYLQKLSPAHTESVLANTNRTKRKHISSTLHFLGPAHCYQAWPGFLLHEATFSWLLYCTIYLKRESIAYTAKSKNPCSETGGFHLGSFADPHGGPHFAGYKLLTTVGISNWQVFPVKSS